MNTTKGVCFVKMQGAGNDYVYILAPDKEPSMLPLLSQKISDRNFGVGGDGLVVILSSEKADFRMRMFNSDGSEAQMCGNAIRCVGKLVYEKGLTEKRELLIETLAGIRKLELEVVNMKVTRVKVDMGEPVLTPSEIPVCYSGEKPMISQPVEIKGEKFPVTAVSMGNPHGVVFVDDITDGLVLDKGPELEKDSIWPEKANIEFAKIENRKEITMRVWERGSGETLACGTGACAVTVASVLNDLTDRKVTVKLRGGNLEVEWNKSDNHVYLTGPAVMVAEGIYYGDEISGTV